ncbi:MAG TPA: serine hydrolase [Patescibacteria group bacterium]|nr:serine hydrolase [Patescibacteria group bacterium]
MFAESLIALVGVLSVQAAKEPPATVLALNSLPVAKYTSSSGAEPPEKKNADSFGVDITARAGAVLDVATGNFLFEKNANTAYPIASLTKLITIMTFLDQNPNLDDEVTIASQDNDPYEKAVFPAGERFTKRELLHAVLIGSVNAAAAALARSTGDHDAFLRAMNEKARSLNMSHAQFFDPTGLDPRNKASAKDVALALRASLSYHEIRDATEQDEFDVTGRASGKPYHIKTTNLLLNSFLNKNPFRIVAGKTGSLPEAGFCLAQATRNDQGNQIIAVVLGSENHFARFQDVKSLTWWAFKNYSWSNLAAD